MFLAELRDVIEQPWQAWELAQADTDRYRSMSPAEVSLVKVPSAIMLLHPGIGRLREHGCCAFDVQLR